MKGRCKWFNDEKGYGFITPDDGSKELFVHHTAIQMGGRRMLSENQPVEFEIEVTGKGPRAISVVPL